MYYYRDVVRLQAYNQYIRPEHVGSRPGLPGYVTYDVSKSRHIHAEDEDGQEGSGSIPINYVTAPKLIEHDKTT